MASLTILMIEALEKGRAPNVNDFGGLSAIINNVDEVVDSGLQDEFLKTALAEFANRRWRPSDEHGAQTFPHR